MEAKVRWNLFGHIYTLQAINSKNLNLDIDKWGNRGKILDIWLQNQQELLHDNVGGYGNI